MLYLSGAVDSLLGNEGPSGDSTINVNGSAENAEQVTKEINIYLLTGVFFALNFLAATQVRTVVLSCSMFYRIPYSRTLLSTDGL